MNVLVEPIPNPVVAVGEARFGNKLPLTLIAGPCALESRGHAFEMAGALKDIAGRLGIGFVYKTSFDKANRTSARSRRGIGLDAALPCGSGLVKVAICSARTTSSGWNLRGKPRLPTTGRLPLQFGPKMRASSCSRVDGSKSGFVLGVKGRGLNR